jgi:hypothetical protein
MTEPTYDEMPLGEIDRVDPYPFHGLVYQLASTGARSYLDPMDGRPAIDRPTPPAVNASRLRSYFPVTDGWVWDIGRPAPPVTPAIFAAGGKAMGKRLLSRSDTNPVRLGDRTHQIEFSAVREQPATAASPVVISWRLAGTTGPRTTIIEVDNNDLGFEFEKLCDESGNLLLRPGYGVIERCAVSVLDIPVAISADGCRWLLRASARVDSSTNQLVRSFTAGFIELVFGLDEAGEITATATITKRTPEVVGTASRTEAGELKRLMGSGPSPPDCTLSFEMVDADPLATSASAGTRTVSVLRRDIIVGAVYDGTEINYYSLSQDYNETEEATVARESYGGGTSDGGDPPRCTGPHEPATPITATYSSVTSASTTVSLGAQSLTAYVAASRSGAASDGVGSRSTTSTSSAGDSITRAGNWSTPLIMRAHDFPLPEDALMVPAIEDFEVGEHTLAFVTTLQGWQTMMIDANDLGAGSVIGRWFAPMLTPTGVKLGYVRRDAVRGSSRAYRGAYNSLTGQAARTGDVEGMTVQGWI